MSRHFSNQAGIMFLDKPRVHYEAEFSDFSEAGFSAGVTKEWYCETV